MTRKMIYFPMEKSVSIFEFETFSSFLAAFIRQRRNGDRTFSFRKMQRIFKTSSASHILMISQGTRVPNPEVVTMLCYGMGLTMEEMVYAQLMVALERCGNEKARAVLKVAMDEIKQRSSSFATP